MNRKEHKSASEFKETFLAVPALGQVSMLSLCLLFNILVIYALNIWDGKVF